MNQKFLILVSVLIGLLPVSQGQVQKVKTAQELIQLFDGVSGSTVSLDIALLSDIDFSQSGLTIPLGGSLDDSCVPYSGTLQGNGHSIKGLKMNIEKTWGYRYAGLFCGLKDAIIENLVIDSSCSFTGRGEGVGALSVLVNGSLTLKNVINKAAISGDTQLGGFIGYIKDIEQTSTISFEHCVNYGSVADGTFYEGGFVGYIGWNSNIAIVISDSTNNGKVSGIGNRLGGFIGNMNNNTNITMDILNSVNNGDITGSGNCIGGLIGQIKTNTNMSIFISNLINNGAITGQEEQNSHTGGFVGGIISNTDTAITISNSLNNGIVTGRSRYVGGLVGSIQQNTNTNMSVLNYTDNGTVTGRDSYEGDVGGLLGDIENNKNMIIAISNSTKNGRVTGRSCNVGGFIGYSYKNSGITMTISNSTNNGIITGSGWVAGFVGKHFYNPDSSFVSYNIINSANKGNISATSSWACGLICISSIKNTTIINSINKGSVNASSYVYGITNEITKARNVVSMGNVTGSSSLYTFWKYSTDVDLFYGLKEKCIMCSDDTILFEYNINTGFYDVVGSNQHVDDLLNDEAVKRCLRMMWTDKLELVEGWIQPSTCQSDSSDSSSSTMERNESSDSSMSGQSNESESHASATSESIIISSSEESNGSESKGTYEIRTAKELIKLFDGASGSIINFDIVLLADLDFSDENLILPLGAYTNTKCVAYSGTFQGNGHSIKGLKMKHMGAMNAGLFCSLNNVTVENLVIDESCVFFGRYVGALSASVTGSLTIKNVTNKAIVRGTLRVGGFIGYAENLKSKTVISFEDCVNDGMITGGNYYTGGFFGLISWNTNMAMTISNSINNGNITGEIGYAGGFVGLIESNTNLTLTLSNFTNNGNITVSQSDAGGFIGCIFSPFVSHSTSLGIINSANKGSVTSDNKTACGVVCVDLEYNNNVKISLINSINKGSVNTSGYAYGMTNNITVARNVVSMGEVTGSSGSYTFWNVSNDVNLFYGLNGKCFNCSADSILFEQNIITKLYEVVGTGKHVHDLLNNDAVNKHFGMMWSKELELVKPYDWPSPFSSQSVPLSYGIHHGVQLFSVVFILVLNVFIILSQ